MKCDVNTEIIPTPNIRLFHSKYKCIRFLRKHGIPFEQLEFANAQTWTFSHGGQAYAVVLYDAKLETPYESDISLLAHEAVHIALYAFQCIGEEEPAEEETCYMVQAIVYGLVKKHFKWKGRRLEREPQSRDEPVRATQSREKE